MLILRGTPALSDFRLQKLSSDFKAAGIPVAYAGLAISGNSTVYLAHPLCPQLLHGGVSLCGYYGRQQR